MLNPVFEMVRSENEEVFEVGGYCFWRAGGIDGDCTVCYIFQNPIAAVKPVIVEVDISIYPSRVNSLMRT